jgi:hypothetical protein
MTKGFDRLMMVVCVVLGLAIGLTACGDGTLDEDPTDSLPNNGAIDEVRCKDACDKVGACFGTTDSTSFVGTCRQNCGQSGYFDNDALDCIDGTDDCNEIFNCGFEY